MSAQGSGVSGNPGPLKQAVRRVRKTVKRGWKGFQDRLSLPHLNRMNSSERVGIVYRVPSEMSIEERLFLFALIRGIRPQRVLEIGSRHGGSAAIISCAMEDNGRGRVIGIDPGPEITVRKSFFHGRFHLITRPSPEAIAEAYEVAQGQFDVLFIDGLHTHRQCAADLAGALPYLAEGAYVLFHDAFHFGVSEAVREALEANPRLHDCGYMCVRPYTDEPLLSYRGLRMLRYATNPVADPQPLIVEGYQEVGLTPPVPHPDLLDHDGWYCRHFEPCPYCRAQSQKAGTSR